MFVYDLKSLVLSGVSVTRDGQSVAARLGFGYPTSSHPRANPIPMRHSDCRTIDPDAGATLLEPEASVASRQRAGRLVRGTGVLVTPWTRGFTPTRGGTWPTAASWSRFNAGSPASVALPKVPPQVQALPQRTVTPGMRPEREVMLPVGSPVRLGKFA